MSFFITRWNKLYRYDLNSRLVRARGVGEGGRGGGVVG